MASGSGRSDAGIEDLATLEAWIWAQLGRGAADKKSPLNTPAVATIGIDGLPTVRTIVLRDCRPSERTLTFHTDSRSRKSAELEANPRLAWHAWHPGLKLQLRIAATATLHSGDGEAAAAWSTLHAGSRALYLHPTPPGTVIAEPDTSGLELAVAGRDIGAGPPATFVVVKTTVQEIEILEIGRNPHRRARLNYTGTAGPSGTWLAP